MHTLRFEKTDDGLILRLPQEIVERAGFTEADVLHVFETAEGVRLVKYDEHIANMMGAYGEVSEQYSNALRELAKS